MFHAPVCFLFVKQQTNKQTNTSSLFCTHYFIVVVLVHLERHHLHASILPSCIHLPCLSSRCPAKPSPSGLPAFHRTLHFNALNKCHLRRCSLYPIQVHGLGQALWSPYCQALVVRLSKKEKYSVKNQISQLRELFVKNVGLRMLR